MNAKFKYLIKNVGILTISNFASKIMIFLLVPLYTSVLTTQEYGIYDLAYSAIQLLLPLFSINIVDAVMRFSMEKTSHEIEDVASIGIKYVVGSCLPIAIFLIICSKTNIYSGINGLEWLLFVYYLFYALNQYFIQLAKGMEKIKLLGAAGIISTIILLLGNILLLLVFNCGLKGFFIANILSQAIPVLFYIIRIKIWKYIKVFHGNKPLQHEMLKYSFPLIFTTISWWINNMSDKYMVAFLCGTSMSGILSVAYKIPSIFHSVQQIFIQAWQVSAIKEYGSDDTPEFYGETFVVVNFILGIICSILILLSKFLASFLYAKDFYIAWKYVPFLLIAGLFNAASGCIGPILMAKRDSNGMAKSAIIGAVANIVLNFILIHFLGVQGATIATAISSAVIYFIRKNAAKNEIVVNDYWINLTGWGILCCQAVINIMSLSFVIEIILLFIFCAININTIKLLLKTLKTFLIRKKG